MRARRLAVQRHDLRQDRVLDACQCGAGLSVCQSAEPARRPRPDGQREGRLPAAECPGRPDGRLRRRRRQRRIRRHGATHRRLRRPPGHRVRYLRHAGDGAAGRGSLRVRRRQSPSRHDRRGLPAGARGARPCLGADHACAVAPRRRDRGARAGGAPRRQRAGDQQQAHTSRMARVLGPFRPMSPAVAKAVA